MRRLIRRRTLAILFFGVFAGTFATFTAPSTAASQEMEDVVYMKDGSVLRGVIIEQNPGDYLLLQTRDQNVLRFSFSDIDRLTREAREAPASAEPRVAVAEKSPGTAMGLSFLVTGLGQFYNGESSKGVLHLVVGAVAAGTMLAGVEDCYAYDDFDCSTFTIGALGVVGTKIWTMWDAYDSAKRINESAGALAFERGGVHLGISPAAAVGPSGTSRVGLAFRMTLPAGK